jgi:hypothetical protein
MEIATVLPITAGQFCLFSYWLPPRFPDFHNTQPTGTFTQKGYRFLWHFPAVS